MKRICSYCKREYGNKLKPFPNMPKGAVSHGICPLCVPRANAEVDGYLARQREEKEKHNG